MHISRSDEKSNQPNRLFDTYAGQPEFALSALRALQSLFTQAEDMHLVNPDYLSSLIDMPLGILEWQVEALRERVRQLEDAAPVQDVSVKELKTYALLINSAEMDTPLELVATLDRDQLAEMEGQLQNRIRLAKGMIEKINQVRRIRKKEAANAS